MFNKILVALDGSQLAESALPHTLAFAKAFQAEVILVRVVNGPTEESGKLVDLFQWRLGKAEAQLYLDNLVQRLQKEGLRARSVVLEGLVSDRILGYALSEQVDLLILSSHGLSGYSGWNISSVVQQIIWQAYLPVLIVRAFLSAEPEWQEIDYQKILVPLDLSSRAECSLAAATWIARHHHSLLQPLHLVSRPEIPRRIPLNAEEQALAEELVDRNKKEAKHYLEEIGNRISCEEFEIEPLIEVCNSTASALHDVVRREKIDLVVLCAHGYSSENKWPFGSIAINLIAFGETPLLIVQDLTADQRPSLQRATGH